MKSIILIFSLLTINLSFAKESIEEGAKNSMLKVLESNEALHASFFKYNPKEVEQNAKKTLDALNAIKNPEFKKLLAKAGEKLKLITATADREANNVNYHQASMAFIYIINKYDLGEKYAGYRCPMVKKKWVQNTKKMGRVHNPYDPSMPHCGGKMN
ncbi:hypothetical protein [Halobacteriovorax marinus]|uniref:hypothetical protein n=1 Tax=Halobacteriovorax marinus TaxID=97084 RepID=UPI003A8D85EE